MNRVTVNLECCYWRTLQAGDACSTPCGLKTRCQIWWHFQRCVMFVISNIVICFSCEKKKWSIIIPAKAWWCCSSLCGICVGTRCLLVKQNTFLTVLFWVWDQSCQSYKSTFSALWLKWPLMFAVCNMSGIILCGTHWLFTSAQMNLYICCLPSLLTQHTSCLNTCVEQDAYFIWLMKCMTQ